MVIYKVTAKKDGEEFYRDYFKLPQQAAIAADHARHVHGASAEWYSISEYEPEYAEGLESIKAKKKRNRL